MGDGVKYLGGMKEALQRPLTAPYTGLAWCVLAAIALLLSGYAIYALVRRRRLQAARWQAFHKKVARLALEPREEGVLNQLARIQCVRDPLKVIQNIDTFENAVDGYVRTADAAGNGTSAVLHTLRARLSFLTPPGVVYYSTRELEPGQTVRPIFFTGRETVAARARVGTMREDTLKLVDVKPPPEEALRGQGAEAVVETPAGTYSFKTEVLDLDKTTASCVTAHALAVSRAGNRRFHRVPIERSVRYRISADGARHQGTLVDLSAGGASLRLADGESLNRGERIGLALQPGRYLGRLARSPEATLDARRLNATVVSVERTGGGGRLYHVEFRGAQPEDERYLFRLVNALERKARAGRK